MASGSLFAIKDSKFATHRSNFKAQRLPFAIKSPVKKLHTTLFGVQSLPKMIFGLLFAIEGEVKNFYPFPFIALSKLCVAKGLRQVT